MIEGRAGNLVVEIKPSGRTNDAFLATSHEYVLFYNWPDRPAKIDFFPLTDGQVAAYAEGDGEQSFKWRDFLRTGGYSTPQERPNSFYAIYYDEAADEARLEQFGDAEKILPLDSEGKERVWRKTRHPS